MLEALRFVQGAIQKNGITPELEHYQIKDGRITGFNGYMALSSPIALDIEAIPKATVFHKALQACGESVAILQTEKYRLHIRSGAFAAFVPCLDQAVFEAAPAGTRFPAPAGIRETFSRLLPLVGDDASRPWAMGVAVGGGTYTVTNNVILLQVWDGHNLPVFNCPRFAVAEVVRIREDPLEIQVDDHSVTFWYPDGRWLRSQLLTQEWPTEKMNSIMDRPSAPVPIPDGLFDGVDQLAPFATEGVSSPIFFTADGLATSTSPEDGATYQLAGLPDGLAFRLKALQLLRNEIQMIDFSTSPCLFYGSHSRGALVGMQF